MKPKTNWSIPLTALLLSGSPLNQDLSNPISGGVLLLFLRSSSLNRCYPLTTFLFSGSPLDLAGLIQPQICLVEGLLNKPNWSNPLTAILLSGSQINPTGLIQPHLFS